MKSENQLGRALVMMAAVICVVCVAGLLTCTWPWDILELPLKTRLFVGLSAAAAWLVSDIVFLRITRPKDPEEIARAALEEEVSVICEFQKVSPIVQAASSVLIRTGRKVDPARLLDSYRLACAKCRQEFGSEAIPLLSLSGHPAFKSKRKRRMTIAMGANTATLMEGRCPKCGSRKGRVTLDLRNV